MRIKAAAILLAAGILSAGCSVKEEGKQEEDKKGERIEFGHAGPAETIIWTSDTFGLCVSAPVNAYNVQCTIGDDLSITPRYDLFWGNGQKTSSTFTAYSPYNGTWSGSGDETFTFKTDQSTDEDLESSILLLAKTEAEPSKGGVDINFGIVSSGIQMLIDNRTGKEISAVSVGDIDTSVKVNPGSASIGATGNKGSIYAHRFGTSYALFLPPQKAKPVISIILSDGKAFKINTVETVTFEQGKLYEPEKITIDNGAEKAVSISFSVSDWDDGGMLGFTYVEENPVPLTDLDECGLYDISGKMPEALFKPAEFDQICCGTERASRSWNVTSLTSGYFVSVTAGANSLTQGGTVAASVKKSGTAPAMEKIQQGSYTFEITKVTPTKVWMEDKGNGIGAIIGIE